MNWLTQTFSSTIGKKVLVAVSGLGLVGFLIAHVSGNLLIFADPDGAALNEYSETLHSIALLPLAEVGLIFFFALHVGLVMQLIFANRAARGDERYAVKASKRPASWAEKLSGRTMAISGIIVLAFIIIHIWHFRAQRASVHGPEATTDTATMVFETLSNPVVGIFYVVASLLIGWHLYHGIHSAFRSIGFNHKKYTPIVEKLGMLISLVIALGFASIPIAIMLGYGNS